jgi:hypothetical protein
MVADDSGHEIKVAEEVGDNSVDNFFANSDSVQPEKTPHCPLTLMPLLARGDLDPSEQDPTMISLGDDVKTPEHLTKGLWNDDDEQTGNVPEKEAGIVAAQKFFRRLNREAARKQADQYCGPVDAAQEWAMDMAENEVDVMAKPLAPMEDVLLVDLQSQPDIDVPAPVMNPIDDALAMSEMPVEVMPEQNVFVPTTQDIEIGPSEITPEVGEADDFVIDMEPELDETFEGTDIIELDDVSTPEDIDVDMSENDVTFF